MTHASSGRGEVDEVQVQGSAGGGGIAPAEAGAWSATVWRAVLVGLVGLVGHGQAWWTGGSWWADEQAGVGV